MIMSVEQLASILEAIVVIVAAIQKLIELLFALASASRAT